MHRITNITITPEILKLIAEIDEFKGRWNVIETLAPEKLTTLRRIATIESVGSSTRIEGSKLSDAEVWSARLEMCQWIRETLDKESIWDEARRGGSGKLNRVLCGGSRLIWPKMA
jgi:hypothetical protein